ncbi:MAG TPA: CRTAC1 family protein, partial [Thermoanaerobaculia bacterium]
GWLDLYVNNDVSPNALLRNLGGEGLPGLFDGIAAATGTADPRGSMGLSVADLGLGGGEPDGLPDLFLTHWVAQENALYQAVRGAGGRLEYRDRARDAWLAEASLPRVGWGSVFADLDRDGAVDLAVANGSTLERGDDPTRLRPEPLFLFWNDGRGRFHDLAAGAGAAFAAAWDARGLAAADYDGDGDVDLAVALDRGGVLLLRNDTATRHRGLAVRLDGPAAAAHGARVEVVAGGRRQVAWAGCDASFLSGHAPELVFGLGPAAAADRVRVTWADGEETVAGPLAAGRAVLRHPRREP